MSRTPNSAVASARPRRTPLAARNRLSVRNLEPGYHYRVVNANLETDPDRVNAFIEQGYEIVPRDKAGQIGDKRVDTASALGSTSEISVGQGTKAILMRIKDEWYKEDQDAKQRQIDEMESTMRSEKADYGDLKISK